MSGERPDLSWRTLLQYARAAAEFTSTPPVSLPASAFERLLSADQSSLPPAQSFELADGAHMAFRHYPLRHFAPSQVVLVHGSAGHSGHLHCIGRAIAERGLAEVYSLDMRGHGSSAGARGHAVKKVQQLYDDVYEFLQHLKRARPEASIILGGHSAGGGLVLRLSRGSAGGLLAGCFMLAPYLGLGAPTMRPLFGGWVKVRSKTLRALALANALGIPVMNGMTAVEFNLGDLGRDVACTPSWSFNTMLAFGPGLWSPPIRSIGSEIAVLGVSGDSDEAFLGKAYPEAFRAVAPHAEVAVISNCGHWDILVDSAAITTVMNWLNRVVPAYQGVVRAPMPENAMKPIAEAHRA